MPTKHPRVNVTKDQELAAAISRARPLMDGAAEATIVRDLAIRGAEALVDDDVRRREALERLIALTTDPDSDLDREALLTVRETAWR